MSKPITVKVTPNTTAIEIIFPPGMSYSTDVPIRLLSESNQSSMRIPVRVGNPPTAIDVPVDAWVVEAPLLTRITQGEQTVAQGLAQVRKQAPVPVSAPVIVTDKPTRTARGQQQQQATRSRSTSLKKTTTKTRVAPATKTASKKPAERGNKRAQSAST